ncbi:hypothetical protein WJX74_002719, partial [Apatococcus lobatus]
GRTLSPVARPPPTCKSVLAASLKPDCWQSCALGDSAEDLRTIRLLAQYIPSVRQLSGATKLHTQQWQGAWLCFTKLQHLNWTANYLDLCKFRRSSHSPLAGCLPKSVKSASLHLGWGAIRDDVDSILHMDRLHAHGFAPVLKELAVIAQDPAPLNGGLVRLKAAQDFSILEKLQISAYAIEESLCASQLTSIDIRLAQTPLDWADHFAQIKSLVHISVELVSNDEVDYRFSIDICNCNVNVYVTFR